MNDRVRTWPALDVRPVPDLLSAALTDYNVVAIDERTPDDWRVFFDTDADRHRAASALRLEVRDVRADRAS